MGLGYVGLPLSLIFSQSDVNVFGFDIDEDKISTLKCGRSYIKHIEEKRLIHSINKGKFHPTTHFERIQECDAVIICVPTPLNHHLEPDLKYVTDTCRQIAPYLKPYCLVSLESTTWPGTTEEVVKPILEDESPLKVGKDLFSSL